MNCLEIQRKIGLENGQETSSWDSFSAEEQGHIEKCQACASFLDIELAFGCLEEKPLPEGVCNRLDHHIEGLLKSGLPDVEKGNRLSWWLKPVAASLVLGLISWAAYTALKVPVPVPDTYTQNNDPEVVELSSLAGMAPVVSELITAEATLEWQGTLDGEPAVFIDLQPEVNFGY